VVAVVGRLVVVVSLVIDFLSDGGENTSNIIIMAHQGKCFSAKISHVGINIEYGNAMTI
jgi:hypothetical protein